MEHKKTDPTDHLINFESQNMLVNIFSVFKKRQSAEFGALNLRNSRSGRNSNDFNLMVSLTWYWCLPIWRESVGTWRHCLPWNPRPDRWCPQPSAGGVTGCHCKSGETTKRGKSFTVYLYKHAAGATVITVVHFSAPLVYICLARNRRLRYNSNSMQTHATSLAKDDVQLGGSKGYILRPLGHYICP